jgi:ABC-type multidrug transport system ATPase subunit
VSDARTTFCDVCVSFGSVTALRDASFAMKAGERVALVGPNGSGKSTIVRLMAGFWQPTHGSVRIDPKSIIGYVPQSLDLWEHLSVEQHLCLLNGGNHFLHPAAFNSADRGEAILIALDLIQLKDRKAHTLSGGQRQRLALARALTHNPKILLLDEFTASLDPQTSLGMLRLLESDIVHSGCLIVFVTHNLKFALEFGTRLMFLDAGMIMEDVSPLSQSAIMGSGHEIRKFFDSTLYLEDSND